SRPVVLPEKTGSSGKSTPATTQKNRNHWQRPSSCSSGSSVTNRYCGGYTRSPIADDFAALVVPVPLDASRTSRRLLNRFSALPGGVCGYHQKRNVSISRHS